MSTATEEAPKAAGLTPYRVSVRHCPFKRENKSRVIHAADPQAAWDGVLALFRQENATLTEAQRKVYGQAQAQWLAAHATAPPDTEVITEEQYQRRLRENEIKERQSRELYEAGQLALKDLAGGLGALVQNFPAAIREAVGQAVTAAVAAVMAQHAQPQQPARKHEGK